MSSMKDLINNIKTFLEADIDADLIDAVKPVNKGLPEDPTVIPFSKMPYIALGDGGERVEDNESQSAQTRYYSVIFVFAAWEPNLSNALDKTLDLSEQVKTSIEKQANRQLDSHVWGVNILPFDWNDEKGFYVGRQVVVDFIELETRFEDY